MLLAGTYLLAAEARVQRNVIINDSTALQTRRARQE
jgi:hypothetical protein